MAQDPDNTSGDGEDGDDGIASNNDAAKSFFNAEPEAKGSEAAGGDKGEAKGTQTDPVKPKLPSILKPKAGETPAPSDTPDELDTLATPDEKSKHRPDWDKMKTLATESRKQAKEYADKLKAMEAQLAARGPEQADAATKARLSELEQQVQDYDAKLKVHDLKSHPSFVNEFIKPQQDALQTIKDALTLEEVDVDVDQIMALDGKKFVAAVSAVLGDLSEFSKLNVHSAFNSAKKLQKAANDALSSTDALRDTYTKQFAARARQSFDEASRQFGETLVEMTIPDDASDEDKRDAEAYNEGLRSLSTKAEAFAFGKTDSKSVSEVAHKAARFDFLVDQAIPHLTKVAEKAITTRDAKIADLENQIKGLTEASPKYQPGDNSEGGEAVEEGDKSHLEAAGKYF